MMWGTFNNNWLSMGCGFMWIIWLIISVETIIVLWLLINKLRGKK